MDFNLLAALGWQLYFNFGIMVHLPGTGEFKFPNYIGLAALF
jgi:hypothetical protein